MLNRNLAFVVVSTVLASSALLLGCNSKRDASSKEQAKSAAPADSSEGQAGGHSSHDHGASGVDMLIVSTKPRQLKAKEPAELKMMIHAADGRMLKDFEVSHEKKVHLIVVREGLDQFAHLHPDVDDKGNLSVTHTFPVPGTYRLFADYKPSGSGPALATAELRIPGEQPEVAPLQPNVPGLVTGDGLDAQVAVEKTGTGLAAIVSFRLQNTEGEAVSDLEPYLGAMGHLVIVSADSKQYVHAHPEEQQAGQTDVRFEAHFPEAGLYKGWGQFQRRGQVYTVPFVVNLE